MTQLAARTIGGAGTGKTRELIGIVEKLLANGADPYRVGFVSLTRAARREAAERAASKFGLSVDDLTRGDGWFRTLHAVCYRQLGVGKELLTDDSAESRRWIEEAMGERARIGTAAVDPDEADEGADGERQTDSEAALRIWSHARNTLSAVAPVWQRERDTDRCGTFARRTPDLARVESAIERYEEAKRLDNRCDFADLLARFAGWRLSVDGPERTTPLGDVPGLTAWILDEAQDVSALSGAVFRRLIDTESCRYVYLSGDPYQAVFRFCGADHRVFRSWPVAKERIAPKSWRCPAPILELGEQILRQCSDYFDRKIAPADHKGVIQKTSLDAALSMVRPDQEWMILTRAGYQHRQIARMLNDAAVPFLNTHGGGEWHAPKRTAAITCLLSMERGSPVGADELKVVIDLIKVGRKSDLLERGTKTRWEAMKKKDLAAVGHEGLVAPEHWESLGITAKLGAMIRSGAWRDPQAPLIDKAPLFKRAVDRWGYGPVLDPKVQLGTIHSAKGREADNVLLLTTTTERCVASAKASVEDRDAEHRVWYVGATRARRRLVLARERNAMSGARPEYRMP